MISKKKSNAIDQKKQIDQLEKKSIFIQYKKTDQNSFNVKKKSDFIQCKTKHQNQCTNRSKNAL